MFSIAYRMLGSVAEAEDVVQDAFLRMHREPGDIKSWEAFATTVTTRLAIDQLRSARARREVYVGPWLPEPLVVTGSESDPAARVEMTDSLSMAFLVLLERLSPVERAVFLLRETFGYEYQAIADVVDKTEANCRQILARARRRIDDEMPRFDPSVEQRNDLAQRFFAAANGGDIEALERLLANDVVFYGDGGGSKAPAITSPVGGSQKVARFVASIFRQMSAQGGRAESVVVNGQPGARIVDADGRLATVLELTIGPDGIAELHNVLNPDKLRHLAPIVEW
jgi:RNA polymerase sigma-70 factor (ECF subfamily)